MQLLPCLLLVTVLLSPTVSECPNACSEHGLCDFYDMCNCFRGFTGGDCSERTCPIDYAFVTSPQGDLNMDGDRDDNSWRRLPRNIDSFKVGGDTITMAGAFDRLEVNYGDLVKAVDQVYEVQWSCTYTVTNGSDCLQSLQSTSTANNTATQWTYTINAQNIIESANVVVAQTSQSANGILTTELTGTGMTTVGVISQIGVIFDTSSNLNVGASTIILAINLLSVTSETVVLAAESGSSSSGGGSGSIVVDASGGRRLGATKVEGVRAALPEDPDRLCRSCTRLIDFPSRYAGERWTELVVESRMEGLLHGFVGLWAEMEDDLITDTEKEKRKKPTKVLDGYPLYRHLRTQGSPYGTWEKWPGDFYGNGQVGHTADEGHFYMECSNRGNCDRLLGLCECHPGYTGKACHIQQCPGLMQSKGKNAAESAVGEPCNGHGTCTTVSSLSYAQPTLMTSKVSTVAGSNIVRTDRDMTASLQIGDVVIIGTSHEIGQTNENLPSHDIGTMKPKQRTRNGGSSNKNSLKHHVVTQIDRNRFFTKAPVSQTTPYGTAISKVPKYELWDADKNRACDCNSRYGGNDCKLRKCPYGDDPLTELGYDATDSTIDLTEHTRVSFYEQKAEKQSLYMSVNGGRMFGTFTLTMEDSYGDRWTTKPIPTKVKLSIVPRDSPT